MTKKLKPFQLVSVRVQDETVEGRARRYTGEVMGYPTPEQTILVRLIPGYAQPFSFVPIADVVPTTARYLHLAEVEGWGSFPSDMLRYDCCVPVNFQIGEVQEKSDRFTNVIINSSWGWTAPVVARCSDSRAPDWTIGRWRSFMWSVIPLKSERIRKAS